MTREPSLLRRITLRLAIATILAGIVAFGWLYRKANIIATALRNETLIAQADDIARHLVIHAGGGLSASLPAALDEAYEESGSAYRYAVYDAYGKLILTSGGMVGPLPPFHDDRPQVYEYHQPGLGSSHVFGAAIKSTIDGRTFETQVEEFASRDQYLASAVTDEFVTDGGWLGVPLLFVLLAVSILTVRRTLSPINRLSQLASEIEPGRTGNRLPDAGVPREIMPLVRAINSALDRLDRGFLRQREFTANAAHQLRTPLAVLRANIDTLPDETVAMRLQKDLDSMTRIVSQLLVAARLEATAIDLDERVDLHAVALDAAASLAPLAIAAGKSIEVDEPPRPVMARGNAWMLLNALNNLIENALVQTPCGTAVRVAVSDEPAIAIVDAGPGVPPHLHEKIFERFWRGDQDKPGAGLGLSIVRRIMRLLGGSVSVGEATGGGAVFTLHLPCGRTA
jgi:signal transduction histidine kinase